MNYKKSYIRLLILVVCISVIIGVAISISPFLSKKKDSYYAVFLTNGQVYFGSIDQIDSGMITLSKVYYLRTQTNLSAQDLENKKEDTNMQLSLVKLGKEFHGPTDQMMINRSQVLFWEKLREDSSVVAAIEKYQ